MPSGYTARNDHLDWTGMVQGRDQRRALVNVVTDLAEIDFRRDKIVAKSGVCWFSRKE
jgi:hypothetical protein